MNIEEIQAIFFQECEEGLNEMETAFAEIRPDSYDVETINTVFRAVHYPYSEGGNQSAGKERPPLGDGGRAVPGPKWNILVRSRPCKTYFRETAAGG